MSHRHYPVRPDLDQLKHQAKDLLRAMHRGDLDAIAELAEHHPEKLEPAAVRLADAQLVLLHENAGIRGENWGRRSATRPTSVATRSSACSSSSATTTSSTSPDARASIRKVDPNTQEVYEYRDVTPVEYGERYYNRILVSQPAMRLIDEGH